MWRFIICAAALLAAYVYHFNWHCISLIDCCVFTEDTCTSSRYPVRILRAPDYNPWPWVMSQMVAVPGVPADPQHTPWAARQFLPPGVYELRFKMPMQAFEEAPRDLTIAVQDQGARVAVMSPSADDPRTIWVDLLAGQGMFIPRGWWYAMDQVDGLVLTL